jgi:hypothetical protein
MAVVRDTLFLIEPGFADPGYGGADEDTRFYCPYCATIEGVLALHPELRERMDVVHVPFRRPRAQLIELLGEENQSLPRLVLADDAPEGLETGSANDIRFISGVENILDVVSQ